MAAPVCGISIMSLRSVVRKRPLRARSSLTNCATSNGAGAASGEPKGTMAMGMASACPLVISTTNSAQVLVQNNRQPKASKQENRLFIGLEPNYEVSFEQCRVRRIRQRRCTIHRIFDGLAGNGIAVALSDPRARHLAARNLGDFDQAVQAHARRRRLDPGMLNSIAQFGDVAVAQRARFDGLAVLLVGHLPAQFRFPVL